MWFTERTAETLNGPEPTTSNNHSQFKTSQPLPQTAFGLTTTMTFSAMATQQ